MTTTPKRRGRPPKKPVLYTYDGVSRTLGEWESIKRMNHGFIKGRMDRGMSFEEALTKPIQTWRLVEVEDTSHLPKGSPTDYSGWRPHFVCYNGSWIRFGTWRAETGMSQEELSKRIHLYGWDFHRALHEPKE